MKSGHILNCNFTNNNASARGGAIEFESNGAVENCNFTNNYAIYAGQNTTAVQFTS